MEAICRAVGATGAMLLQSDVRTCDVPRTPSFDEPLNNYFRTSFHLKDIRADRSVPLLLNGASVVIDQDILTADEMRSDPMYNETLFPFGFQWFSVVGFRAESALWGLCIQRTSREGAFENRDKRILATLSQRLTEVSTLSKFAGQAILSGTIDALNGLRRAAIAIDRQGVVLGVNAAAQAAFNDRFRVKNRRLFVSDAQARKSLDDLIDRLRIVSDMSALPCDPIVIRRDGGTPIVVRVLPVHGGVRGPFLGARALLTFTSPDSKSELSPTLLAKAFDLTPAEARLAIIIARGVSPEGAADEFGISKETVRNQLKSVFTKTSTHRQAELVALLNPL